MNPVFICDAIRAPIGRYGSSLSSIRPDDLAAINSTWSFRLNAAYNLTARAGLCAAVFTGTRNSLRRRGRPRHTPPFSENRKSGG